ncbi:tyrosine-type recombinase/integrase [Clostridium sp. C8-1-8]|uniref:tyrosine-type recombinase/integrase n=1 Tax=Clostridium sp. C8-1-8 TaxID=2698831 RepID=UPI001FAC473B|nr:tyrosine-type recombinase/integrase [Clostridium sp. C8-1-8]
MENNYEVATINKKINSIHSLNRYLIAAGEMKEIVVKNSKDRVKIAYGSEKQVEVYSEKEVDKILFYIQNEDKVSKRNKVIIMLLLYTGVRVSELCSIKIRDIDFLNYSIKIYGKGGKFREVPLKFDLADAIKEYIKDRDYNAKDSEYLIAGHSSIDTTMTFYINSSREEKMKALSLL